jgi:hypothetical protein
VSACLFVCPWLYPFTSIPLPSLIPSRIQTSSVLRMKPEVGRPRHLLKVREQSWFSCRLEHPATFPTSTEGALSSSNASCPNLISFFSFLPLSLHSTPQTPFPLDPLSVDFTNYPTAQVGNQGSSFPTLLSCTFSARPMCEVSDAAFQALLEFCALLPVPSWHSLGSESQPRSSGLLNVLPLGLPSSPSSLIMLLSAQLPQQPFWKKPFLECSLDVTPQHKTLQWLHVLRQIKTQSSAWHSGLCVGLGHMFPCPLYLSDGKVFS